MATRWLPLCETWLTLVYQELWSCSGFLDNTCLMEPGAPVRVVFCLLQSWQALARSVTHPQGVPTQGAFSVCILSTSRGHDFHKPTYVTFLSPYTACPGSKHSHFIATKRFPKSALTWALVRRKKWFNTDKYVQWQLCSVKWVKAYNGFPASPHHSMPLYLSTWRT